MSLPKPTKERIIATARHLRDKKDTSLDLATLKWLFRKYPKNANVSHVLVKATVLNHLYSTRIIKIRDAARVIVKANIDQLLKAGDSRAVKKIGRMRLGGVPRGTYSFATKYSHWHNRDRYPILDSNVVTALWQYRRRDSFAKFRKKDLSTYAEFRTALRLFRENYGIQGVSTIDLDKFLWDVGRLIRKRKRHNR